MSLSKFGGMTVLLIAVFLIVGLAAGYFIGGSGKVSESQYSQLQTSYNQLQALYNQLQQNVSQITKKLKVGFIYVGPVEISGGLLRMTKVGNMLKASFHGLRLCMLSLSQRLMPLGILRGLLQRRMLTWFSQLASDSWILR